MLRSGFGGVSSAQGILERACALGGLGLRSSARGTRPVDSGPADRPRTEAPGRPPGEPPREPERPFLHMSGILCLPSGSFDFAK
mmetsp:Transcript_147322/g.473350  ORF Transcript_147322/g.473350 Transcript_147322/m.473350 type:complete len:84 (-) Transcript_147322:2667-2918(-)